MNMVSNLSSRVRIRPCHDWTLPCLMTGGFSTNVYKSVTQTCCLSAAYDAGAPAHTVHSDFMNGRLPVINGQ